jgi:ATP-dependent helicase YprA (DUF1998 family)
MSDYSDNEELVLTEDFLRVLDGPLDDSLDVPLDPAIRERVLELGSEDYCIDYKQRLVQKAQAIANITPYDWQLDAALATHLGKDVFILAGTGYGKTLPFVLNCWMDKSLIVWIVSPLNALANQQAKTFLQWGISATAVNSTTTSSELYRVCKRSHILIP